MPQRPLLEFGHPSRRQLMVESSHARSRPCVFGRKHEVTEIVQFAPAATLVPQLLISEKSSRSVPVIEIAVMVTATLDLIG